MCVCPQTFICIQFEWMSNVVRLWVACWCDNAHISFVSISHIRGSGFTQLFNSISSKFIVFYFIHLLRTSLRCGRLNAFHSIEINRADRAEHEVIRNRCVLRT